MFTRPVTAKISHSKKIFITGVTGLVVTLASLGLIIAPATGAISIGGPSDCDDNAIIRCGTHSTAALMNAYQSSAYVRGVYAYFGISQADMANLPSTNVAGHVNKDGKVYVDGRSNPVATGAMTGGRQNIAGSNQVNSGGAVFFVRPPSVSFQQASLPAFVSMKNGQFQFAVIASCGNAVRAAAVQQAPSSIGQAKPVSKMETPPKKPAPKPAPAPALTQAQVQSQSQNVNVTNTSTNTNTVNNKQVTTPAPPEQPATTETTTVASQPTAPAQPTETTTPAPAETSSQPTSLVNTGPSDAGIIGLFLAVSGASAFAFRRFLAHRLGDVTE